MRNVDDEAANPGATSDLLGTAVACGRSIGDKRMRVTLTIASIVALCLTAAHRHTLAAYTAAAPAKVASPTWSVRVEPLQEPSGPHASGPRFTVSDRGVLLSWLEHNGNSTTLKFAEKQATGWSSPTTVSSGANWMDSAADPPIVLRRPDGSLVASWQVSTDKKLEGSDLYLTYSKDNGKTWAPSFMPHHDRTRGQHAFASLFEVPGNGLGLVWLDARAQAAHPDDLDASISLRYAAFDGSWKQTADAEIDPRVCECCSTTAAVTSDGVLIAFRDRSDKEIRDIAVSRLERGKWTPSTLVHADNWEIDACPVNGPMLSARGRQAVIAWFTVKDQKGQAWAAFSTDAGRTWGAPIRLDDVASLGRVDVNLLDDGSAVATWVEYANRRAQFSMRHIDPAGQRSPAVSIAAASSAVSSDIPRMARQGRELVFAWTEAAAPGDHAGASSVHTARATLP
jgi:hypothetical protein